MDIPLEQIDHVRIFLVRLSREQIAEKPDYSVGPRRLNVYREGFADKSTVLSHWKLLKTSMPEKRPLKHRHRPCVLLDFKSNQISLGVATIDWGFGSIVTEVDRFFGVRDFDALNPHALEARKFLEDTLRSGTEIKSK